MQFFYNPTEAAHWLATVKCSQKPQHTPHIMSYVTPISTRAKILPLMRKYLAAIHHANFVIIAHVHLTTLCVSMLHRMDIIHRSSEHIPTYH